MINETNYFFDTYAVIELSEGNANYSPYASASVVTTKLNFFTLSY